MRAQPQAPHLRDRHLHPRTLIRSQGLRRHPRAGDLTPASAADLCPKPRTSVAGALPPPHTSPWRLSSVSHSCMRQGASPLLPPKWLLAQHFAPKSMAPPLALQLRPESQGPTSRCSLPRPQPVIPPASLVGSGFGTVSSLPACQPPVQAIITASFDHRASP